jgi:hypothetical protein
MRPDQVDWQNIPVTDTTASDERAVALEGEPGKDEYVEEQASEVITWPAVSDAPEAQAVEEPAPDRKPRRPAKAMPKPVDSTPPEGRSVLSDVLGLAWVVALGVGVLLPALFHGSSFGPYDILENYSLTSHGTVHLHNWTLGDQIRLFIPWTNLVWTQVHQGHLPLWNPYSALGMPLAFNWQSAPFAFSTAIGYLFPVHLAYTVQVVVTVVVAGTGAYVLGRVLGLSTLGCVMAGTAFELSGPFIAWLGWPLSTVMSWSGWVFAALVLVLRGKRRAGPIVFLAVAVAFVVLSGDPEAVVLLGLSSVIFAAVVLVLRTSRFGGSGAIRRPVLDAVVAFVLGGCLAAPVVLPGLQLAAKSNRTAVGPTNGPKTLPLSDLVHVIFQGFHGLPLNTSTWFGYSNYEETTAYVGVIALVLAAAAIVTRWRRPEVVAFVAVGVVMAALVFGYPLVDALDAHVIRIYWVLALTPMIFTVCMLAGFGTDLVLKAHRERSSREALAYSFAIAALVILLVWLFGRQSLPSHLARIRADSFIWPAVSVVVGLLSVSFLYVWSWRRRMRPGGRWRLLRAPSHGRTRRFSLRRLGAGHIAAFVLLACEAGFLYASGAPMPSSSPMYLKPTSSVTALKSAIGSSVVGFDVPCSVSPRVGILENDNSAFGIQEMSVYDPMTPQAYYNLDWQSETGYPGGRAQANNFCPVFPTASLARQFGVGYVLQLPNIPGPTGSVLVGPIGNEELYRIPGAAVAILIRDPSSGRLPSLDASGKPVAVSHPNSAAWKMHTDSSSRTVLRLHLTNVPGWHATIDGKPLQLQPYDHVMLQAVIPPGAHTIELHYMPDTFLTGLVIALLAAVFLVAMLVISALRARRPAPAHLDGKVGGGALLITSALRPKKREHKPAHVSSSTQTTSSLSLGLVLALLGAFLVTMRVVSVRRARAERARSSARRTRGPRFRQN